MSVNTSVKINPDALQAALPAGAAYSTAGGDLASSTSKTITFYGTDDATGQAAITTAAGQFVDRDANKATLQQQAQTALARNRAYAASSPTTAQAVAESKNHALQLDGIIRQLLNIQDVPGSLDGTN